MKRLILSLLSFISLTAFANAQDFVGATIQNRNIEQITCIQAQVTKASGGSVVEIKNDWATIDFFGKGSARDLTKGDILFHKLVSDVPRVVKLYALRITSTKNTQWQYYDVGNGRMLLYAPVASTTAELFDFSVEGGVSHLKNFLFNVDLSDCRPLIEIEIPN